jgi:hypothetical protein
MRACSGDGVSPWRRHNGLNPEPALPTPPPTSRLQIATRIHFLLLRELGRGIELGAMLNRPLYARDVLLVCDAHPGAELARLAQRFRAASAAPPSESAAASGFNESAFAADSSGFGHAQPLPAGAPRPDAQRGWLGRLLG